MEMPTSRLGARHPGSCWRLLDGEALNLQSQNSTWGPVGRASRLASVLGEAMDDGSGTFAGHLLVVVLLRVSRWARFRGVFAISANCGVRGTFVCTPKHGKVGWPANVGRISNGCCHREASQHRVYVCWGGQDCHWIFG